MYLHEVQRRGVRFLPDSWAAVSDCRRMRSKPEVFAAVRQLYVLAMEHGIELTFDWVPREHPALVLADALSKLQDASDWRLSRTIGRQYLCQLGWPAPDVDVFGSAGAHFCFLYYSRECDGVCAGVDDLNQRWDRMPAQSAQVAAQPRKLMCWVFPPPALLMPALCKLQSERADALVVSALEPPVHEAALLRSLASQSVPLQAPHHVLVQPTRRVPREVAEGGWHTRLQLCRIVW